MNAETINKILGITEAYKMPEVLSGHLFDCEKRERLFDEFMAVGEALDHDWFTEYFQTEHGDRERLKQDYTPDSICEITTKVSRLDGVVADICCGTGGLTLKAWQNGAREFFCLEFAERVIPMLLMNLSIRNIKATVVHGDALSKETFKAYRLIPGERYSDIQPIEDTNGIQDVQVDAVIMNPPYSMKWDGDRIFKGYETPPKSKCDFAFLLDGLEKLKEGGTLTAILPHGVLFRGAREEKVRRKLVENGYFDTIIGLPDKLFLNTDIPVAIIKLQKKVKEETAGESSEDDSKNSKEDNRILVIDASKEFKKDGNRNIMEGGHIEKVLSAVSLRAKIDKFADVTGVEKIRKNNYNLNIPRYVDTYDPPPPIDIVAVTKELWETEKKIRATNHEIRLMIEALVANTKEAETELKAVQQYWRALDEL